MRSTRTTRPPLAHWLSHIPLGALVLALGLPAACAGRDYGGPPPLITARHTASTAATSAAASNAEPVPEAPRHLRVLVAGESIERRTRWAAPPFLPDGTLNERGGGASRNDNDEYGWPVPFADRIRLRAPTLRVQWAGSDRWQDADDRTYSGSYPSTTADRTLAISGSSIDSWLAARGASIRTREFCYDIAIAARGGNDFSLDDDAAVKASLKRLIVLLAAGSNCRDNAPVYVTAHGPDNQGHPRSESRAYIEKQKRRFRDRFREAVDELKRERPSLRLYFVDWYSAFLDNRPTRAFPNETWTRDGIVDFAKITRINDGYHIRRLASIYEGELLADSIVLDEVVPPTVPQSKRP